MYCAFLEPNKYFFYKNCRYYYSKIMTLLRMSLLNYHDHAH